MTPLDPASVAALVAALALRTDDLTFEVTSVPTLRRYGAVAGIAAAEAAALAPASPATARFYSWAAYYRFRPLYGYLVADAVHATAATGLLALQAGFAFDTVDLRYPKPQDPAPVAPPWYRGT